MSTYVAWTDSVKNQQVYIQSISAQSTPLAVPNAFSNYGPALASFNQDLYVAWTGTDSNHTLNVASYDGANWSSSNNGNTTISSNVYSEAGPALIATNYYLCLVWIGTNGEINLIVSTDGKTWNVNNLQTLNLISNKNLSPALAIGHVQNPMFACTGPDNNVYTFGGLDALANIDPVPVDNLQQSLFGPALAFFNHKFYLAFVDGNNTIQMCSTLDDVYFTLPISTTVTSSIGAALAVSGAGSSSLLTLAWTDKNDNSVNAITSANAGLWGSKIPLAGTSKWPPAIASASF